VNFCEARNKKISVQPAVINPLMGTLKPQSNEPLYSNTVIGTQAVDGWAVTFGTARRGLSGLGLRPVPFSLYPNVTAHPSTASVPTLCHSMRHSAGLKLEG